MHFYPTAFTSNARSIQLGRLVSTMGKNIAEHFSHERRVVGGKNIEDAIKLTGAT